MDHNEGGEGEDDRREEAIASAQALQTNFKSKHVNQDQLSKLQELHKRRLEIKSKIHKKSKDGSGKSCGRGLRDKDSVTKIELSGIPDLKNQDNSANFSATQDNASVHQAAKKLRILHWGLDTKERWERKANM